MNDDVPIRPASTVVLIRDGADGLEVWLQQRAATLAFAANMFAFPGGAVDDTDGEAELPTDLLTRHAKVWGDDDLDVSGAHLAAGVRETWEESGVTLDITALKPWTRWVTPPGEVRRFDARFYIAACPTDQQPQPLTGEVATGRWFVLTNAVREHGAGTLPMWPPTISTLMELLPFDTVAEVEAAVPSRVEVIAG